MAPKGGSGSRGVRGFAGMDDDRKRSIARKGGLASAKGKKTSNRGFASMDKSKQREISSMGGKASRSLHGGPHEENDADEVGKEVASEKSASDRDLTSLENTGDPDLVERTQESLASSETDEDEDEGLGDGNLGRSRGGAT